MMYKNEREVLEKILERFEGEEELNLVEHEGFYVPRANRVGDSLGCLFDPGDYGWLAEFEGQPPHRIKIDAPELWAMYFPEEIDEEFFYTLQVHHDTSESVTEFLGKVREMLAEETKE